MTLSDLEWPFYGSSVRSVREGRANVDALYTSSPQKSTSSAPRAISAVAELLLFSLYMVILCLQIFLISSLTTSYLARADIHQTVVNDGSL